MNSKSNFPWLETFAWLAPLMGLAILVIVTFSGAWSGANFSGGLFSGISGIVFGLLMGLVAGAILAFPYFIMGELSKALVELVTNSRDTSSNTRKLIEVLRDQSEQSG